MNDRITTSERQSHVLTEDCVATGPYQPLAYPPTTVSTAIPLAGRTAYRACVLVVAALVRLCVVAYALTHFGVQWFFTRGLEMGLVADSLVHGTGMSSPFGTPTGPTAMIAPGYPLLVAGVFRLCGTYSLLSAVALNGINLGFNVLSVWLIMRLASRLASERCALIAGGVWACSLPLLWMPTIFWETSLSTFFLLGSVALGLKLRDCHGDLIWLMYGLYGGVECLLNPALLPCMAIVPMWAFLNSRPKLLRKPLLAAVVFLLIYSSWPVRNFRAFHAWVPTRTTIGMELWMGNHPGNDGYLQEGSFPSFNKKELQEYKTEGEIKYTSEKAALAVRYILDHPARFLQLTGLRFARFWLGAGTRNGSLFFVLHAATTSLLGICGLCLLFRSKERNIALLFALILTAFPLPYYLTHAEFRYRLVVDPLMTILSVCVGGRRPLYPGRQLVDRGAAEGAKPSS